MQIIIPLTGYGSRFKACGYNALKPFISLYGHTVIEWVVKLFPGDADKISFICRKEHLDTLPYVKKELKKIAPKARIFAIDNWIKRGPVNDILLANDIINDFEPIIISYCDYYMHWDYKAFKKELERKNPHGAIPCYSGFHPHLIKKENLYATCKVDASENLIEIREKFAWHSDKTKDRHSPGTYYFRNAALFKRASEQMIKAKDSIAGEFYASLLYNYLVGAALKVWCPINVRHFCQWGTPYDLEESLFWLNSIKKQKENSENSKEQKIVKNGK